jgi:hypothetical protein
VPNRGENRLFAHLSQFTARTGRFPPNAQFSDGGDAASKIKIAV